MDILDQFQQDNPHNKWYCLMTFGKQEYGTCERLEQLFGSGPIKAYCPVNVVEFKTRSRRRDEKRNPNLPPKPPVFTEKPMIPGYIFISLQPSDTIWYRVRQTRGVYGILCNHTTPVRINHELIMTLRSSEPETMSNNPVIDPTLKAGENVLVTRGQFKGSEYRIKGINGPLATLDATLFGKSYPLVLPLSFLVRRPKNDVALRAHVHYTGG